MKAATIHEIKKELLTLDKSKVTDLCLRIAKFKKDNKDLLTYLLFEAHDEDAYIKAIKEDIDEQFEELNKGNLYYTRKGLRKILRGITKFIRYSGSKNTEAEVLLYYCHKIKLSGIPLFRSSALLNLYAMQIKKLTKVISTLHEDLQFDYGQELENLK